MLFWGCSGSGVVLGMCFGRCSDVLGRMLFLGGVLMLVLGWWLMFWKEWYFGVVFRCLGRCLVQF